MGNDVGAVGNDGSDADRDVDTFEREVDQPIFEAEISHLQITTGGTTYNFSGVGDADPERVRLAFTPADYARLAKAKATYDPENMFRINFNIPPG